MAKISDHPGSSRRFRVAVVGAGFGGIAAIMALRKVGINDVTIFERSPNIGGTWWENIYPGCEIDAPSHLYSLSFAQYDWSRSHPRQPEILSYLEHVIDRFGLRAAIRLNTAVTSVGWSDASQTYTLRTAGGEALEFDAVVSAVGFLTVPRIPDWPGLDGFRGDIFHSARWPVGIDLAGKSVGVVGTGSTAVQIVAEVAKVAKNVTVFQRDPNWVVRKNNRELTTAERARLSIPLFYRLRRLRRFIGYERMRLGGGYNTAGSRKNRKMQADALTAMNAVLAGRPDIIKFVTPGYPFHGKRTVVSDDYYETLLRPHVALAPSVVRATSEGLVDAAGATHNLDVIALATGFDAANFLSSLKVTGRGGRDLHQVWHGEPAALLGISLPCFPNFFMMYGPNTNGSPVIYLLECQAKFIANTLRDLRRRGGTSVEADPQMFKWYNDWLQDRLSRTTWAIASNYFKASSGRIVTQWPFTGTMYWFMSRSLRRPGMRMFSMSAMGEAVAIPPTLMQRIGSRILRLWFSMRSGPGAPPPTAPTA